MSNAYLSRAHVHALSDEIGRQSPAEQAALQRMLKEQRRLTRFVEENQKNLLPPTASVCVYLFGVIARIFDRSSGRLKAATWEQVRDAEAKVGGAMASILPLDAGFKDRIRAIEWRAQPHILDEALMALFDRPTAAEEEELPKDELFKVFALMWVATEVLDDCWKPAAGFQGETAYTYVHIEPTPIEPAPAG
jgi:hypothetical protein